MARVFIQRTDMEKRYFILFCLMRYSAAIGVTASPIIIVAISLSLDQQGSTLAFSLGFQSFFLLFGTLISGSLVDRYDRKCYMILCYSIISLSYIIFLTLLSSDAMNRILLICVASNIGLFGGLLGPSLQSVIPLIVPEKDLVKSNATLRIGLNTSSVISPGVTGLLVSKINIETPVIIISIFYLLSVLFAFFLPRLPHAHGGNIFKDTIYGWKQFWKIKWLRNISVGFAVTNLIWAGFFYSLGPLMINYFGREISHWGIITGALSAGLIFGSMLFRKIEFNNPLETGLLFSIGKFLPLISIYLGLPTPIIAFFAFIAGLLLECFIINYYSFVQINIEQSILARILSIDSFIGLLFTPVGYIISSFILGIKFTQPAGILASLLMIVIPLLILFINKKNIPHKK